MQSAASDPELNESAPSRRRELAGTNKVATDGDVPGRHSWLIDEYPATLTCSRFIVVRRAVRLFSQIVAFVLLVLWMPATQHCVFGAVTGWETNPCENACNHDSSGAHKEACTVVESGDYTSAVTLAHVPAPNLTALECFACLHARLLAQATPLAPPPWTKDDPVEWVPVWAFATRAALPGRAPNLI